MPQLEASLSQPRGEEMATLVLACTHFPLVEEELAAAAPRPLAFVDGKEGIARRTAWLLRDKEWSRPAPEGRALFTRRDDSWRAYAPGLAGYGLTEVSTL